MFGYLPLINRRDLDMSGITKSEYKKPQFLYDEPILSVVLGGVCFKEGMDLFKRKLLSLVLLYT